MSKTENLNGAVELSTEEMNLLRRLRQKVDFTIVIDPAEYGVVFRQAHSSGTSRSFICNAADTELLADILRKYAHAAGTAPDEESADNQ
jgi:hypothetical protein